MARPREFEEAAVLDAAVQCFWARGYEATSVRDLAEQMDIAGASLYNAFGDKRALFRRALSRYVDQGLRERIARLEASLAPRQAIGAFFAGVVERSLADKERKGCLLVNSALEIAPHDPEFQRLVAEAFVAIEAFLRRCVVAGQRAGTIAAAQSAEDLARLMLGALIGLRVLARARPERALLEGVLRPVFALLDDVRD